MDEIPACLSAIQGGLELLTENVRRLAANLDAPAPAPPSPEDFGEPWERHGEALFASPHDGCHRIASAEPWTKERGRLLDRAVACVNGLAGIKYPAAVGPLIAWIRENLEKHTEDHILVGFHRPSLEHCLTALDKEPDDEK